MAQQRNAALSVTLQNSPPRPAAGTGDVVMRVGDRDLTLKWENGKVADIASPSEPDATMRMETLGAIVCYKCWVDTDTGQYICLPTQC